MRLPPVEEKVLVYFYSHGTKGPHEVADALDIPIDVAETAVESLYHKGMLKRQI